MQIAVLGLTPFKEKEEAFNRLVLSFKNAPNRYTIFTNEYGCARTLSDSMEYSIHYQLPPTIPLPVILSKSS